jgi:manganese/iron transport system substrate-binding protein
VIGARLLARVRASLIVGLFVAVAVGCSGSGGGEESSDAKLTVAATTSVIADMVGHVGGNRVEVTTIVPVGGSPETFQPSPRDAGRISEARVVFENGAGLDAWVEDLVESAGSEDQRVVVLSEGLEAIGGDEHEDEHAAEEDHGSEADPEEAGHEHSEGNPHFWLDVKYAERYVERIRDALAEADPEGAEEYEANAREYLGELQELDRYIRKEARSIPEERRKLVTFHDAFPYFAEAYGFELVGVILENPEAEPGSREVAEVVRTIEEEDVPAVFTEPQFNAGLADTVAQEADVRVYELYTDTLVENEAGSTYQRMMRTNIDRLVEVLGQNG